MSESDKNDQRPDGPFTIEGKLYYQNGRHLFSCTCIAGPYAEEVVSLFARSHELPRGEHPAKQAAFDAFYATAKRDIPHNDDGTHSGTFWHALMCGIDAYLKAAQGLGDVASGSSKDRAAPCAVSSIAATLDDALGINQDALNEAGWKLLGCGEHSIHVNRVKDVAREVIVAYINSVHRQKLDSVARYATKPWSAPSARATTAKTGPVYLLDGKPHRLCDCDTMKGDCPRGNERQLQTTQLSRCLVPADGVVIL